MVKIFFKRLYSHDGIALPLVVVVVALVVLFGLTAFYVVNTQSILSARYSKNEEALHIAEAGVNRVLYLLNEYPEFAKNPDIIDYNEHEDNTLVKGSFELELVPATADNPVVTIISTGTLHDDPDISRTLQVEASKRSFTNYVYFSDNDGNSIWWLGNEKCFGPLHTNTTLNIKDSPIFFSTVTYGASLNKGSPYNPVFLYFEGYEPMQVEPLIMPSNNSTLENVTLALFSDHHYTGRTSILLKGDRYDVHYWDGSEYIFEADKLLPANGVIYVAGEEGTGYPTPNKFGNEMGNVFVSGVLDGRLTIAAENNIYITGRDPTEFIYDDAALVPGGGISYHDTTISVNETTGEITVGGTANDMLGLVANNYIYVLCWGWFDYAEHTASDQRTHRPDVSSPDNTEIYGAVFALNKGFGYEPYWMNSQGDYINASGQNIWTSDHEKGTPAGTGKIVLRGSLIQNTRKPVGIMTSPPRGYQKDYAHDTRMSYDSPPYFLEPENAGWEMLSWKED